MSGHSKWSTIKRQKGANDMKRGQAFTKLSNAITMAVKQGGNIADPEMNFRLRIAIEAARNSNMPKDNIERAIARASGKQDASLEEVVYEGFGPGGISVVVEGLTDNKQRTVSEVKNAFDKNGGTMGAQGSVMYQFQRAGVLIIDKENKSFDDIFLTAVDAGAQDVEEEGSEAVIYTRPEELDKTRTALQSLGFKIKQAELTYKPLTMMTIEDKPTIDKTIAFLEKMEDLGDIQKVYTNFDIAQN